MKFWSLIIAAMPAAVLAQAAPSNGLTNFPDIPQAEPVTETVFGITIADPYRWMERADRRADMEKWVNASSQHTTRQLAALPGRNALLQELEAASRATAGVHSVQEGGKRLFFERLDTNRNIPVLMVREDGKDRIIFDPMAGTDGKTPRAISSYTPSPDGKYVAVQLSEGGNEISTIRFYDVATGKAGSDALTPTWAGISPQWLDDNTIVYTRMAPIKPGADPVQNMTAYLHVMGTPISADKPLLGPGAANDGFAIRMSEVPVLVADVANSDWVLAAAASAGTKFPFAVARLADIRAGNPHWHKLGDYDDNIKASDDFYYNIVGNKFYYVSTKNDPNGEIRVIDLTKPNASAATSDLVLPANGRVFSETYATRDGVYILSLLPNGANGLYFLPHNAKAPVKVAVPDSEGIGSIAIAPDARSITFMTTGYKDAGTYYRASGGRAVPLGLANETPEAAKASVVVEEWATSADGTRVPLTILYSGKRTGPAPTVLYAYGSYATSIAPALSRTWMIWTQHGWNYAVCHVRGGGELGEAWHRAGQGINKGNAQEDLIGCGKRLVELGYTTPATLGLNGGSAAGLTLPIAAMKAPDLFAAVVMQVGDVNVARMASAANSADQYGEMGDPNTEAGFKSLVVQDATLYLPRAKGGPDFLFTIGLNDHHIEPWMSAKLAAMMRVQWGDQHLALIRSDAQAGHGLSSSRSQILEERADMFAFFLNRFGVTGFTK